MLRRACVSAPLQWGFTKSAIVPLTKTPPTSSIPSQASLFRTTLASNANRNRIAAAAFHSTPQRAILPPLPQRIDGTANDASPTIDPSPTHGSYHWVFERLIAASLIPLTVAPFAAGSLNPTMDALLCGTILIHSHIGFQSIIIDYIPSKRLPITRKVAWWGLRGATLLVAVGLYEFETNDIGVTETIKKIWTA